EPAQVADRGGLQRILVNRPWDLEPNAARWIVSAGIGYLRTSLPALGSEGSGFESLRARNIVRGLSCSDAVQVLRHFCPVWTVGVTWVPHRCRPYPRRFGRRRARDLRVFRLPPGRPLEGVCFSSRPAGRFLAAFSLIRLRVFRVAARTSAA